MTTQNKCPDCGVGVGQPQHAECNREAHDPAKSVWTGALPLNSKSRDNTSADLITSEGFAIYCLQGSSREHHGTPTKQEPTPHRKYPDSLLERNARWTFRTSFVEPVFNGGQMTGSFRACRRCPDGIYELAEFPSRDDAVEWAKQYERC
jgi:hypothetical protein